MDRIKTITLSFLIMLICTACEDYLNDGSEAYTYLPKWSLTEPEVGRTDVLFKTQRSDFSESGFCNDYNFSLDYSNYSHKTPYLCIKAGKEMPSDPVFFFADAQVLQFISPRDFYEESFFYNKSYSYTYPCFIPVSGLQPNTTYYYALFYQDLKDSDTTKRLYGEVKSFRTKN